MAFFNIIDLLQSVFFGTVGESTWLHIPAVVLRVIILYMFAFLLLRLMGKRQNKQLTMFDAVVIVILGDLIGTPTIDFQIPLLFAMFALTVFITIERGFIILIQHSERLSEIIESKPSMIIENGKINAKLLHKEKMGIGELYASLRLKGIKNLGDVEKAYLEDSGEISIFKNKRASKGLSIFPTKQGAPPHHNIGESVPATQGYFCWYCGEKNTFNTPGKFTLCSRCGGKEWVSPDND
ncbi:MAG: DUF421 domain-containing protein [Crenarchaeota archaeon]|nr:DUF421 domain-containing protein [Thermoproteota archaeon]